MHSLLIEETLVATVNYYVLLLLLLMILSLFILILLLFTLISKTEIFMREIFRIYAPHSFIPHRMTLSAAHTQGVTFWWECAVLMPQHVLLLCFLCARETSLLRGMVLFCASSIHRLHLLLMRCSLCSFFWVQSSSLAQGSCSPARTWTCPAFGSVLFR